MSDDWARWEYGSLFSESPVPSRHCGSPWAGVQHVLTGSGRDALKLLLRHRTWGTVWVPSFFCQEVVASIVDEMPSVRVYSDSPLQAAVPWEKLEAGPDDLVVTVAYFGLRDIESMTPPVDRSFSMPSEDAELSQQIRSMLGRDVGGYGIALLDYSDPSNPRYAGVMPQWLCRLGGRPPAAR